MAIDPETWNLALGLRATVSSSQLQREIRRLKLQSNRSAIDYGRLWSPDGMEQIKQRVESMISGRITERVAYRTVLLSVLDTYRAMLRGENMPKAQ